MKYLDLLEGIKGIELHAEGYWGTKALRAVVELHKPSKLDDGCAHCKLTNTDPRPYPCPTIQAIEKELGINE